VKNSKNPKNIFLEFPEICDFLEIFLREKNEKSEILGNFWKKAVKGRLKDG
jgi:hypothetical protein